MIVVVVIQIITVPIGRWRSIHCDGRYIAPFRLVACWFIQLTLLGVFRVLKLLGRTDTRTVEEGRSVDTNSLRHLDPRRSSNKCHLQFANCDRIILYKIMLYRVNKSFYVLLCVMMLAPNLNTRCPSRKLYLASWVNTSLICHVLLCLCVMALIQAKSKPIGLVYSDTPTKAMLYHWITLQ